MLVLSRFEVIPIGVGGCVFLGLKSVAVGGRGVEASVRVAGAAVDVGRVQPVVVAGVRVHGRDVRLDLTRLRTGGGRVPVQSRVRVVAVKPVVTLAVRRLSLPARLQVIPQLTLVLLVARRLAVFAARTQLLVQGRPESARVRIYDRVRQLELGASLPDQIPPFVIPGEQKYCLCTEYVTCTSKRQILFIIGK